jgi:hypothetical protein
LRSNEGECAGGGGTSAGGEAAAELAELVALDEAGEGGAVEGLAEDVPADACAGGGGEGSKGRG